MLRTDAHFSHKSSLPCPIKYANLFRHFEVCVDIYKNRTSSSKTIIRGWIFDELQASTKCSFSGKVSHTALIAFSFSWDNDHPLSTQFTCNHLVREGMVFYCFQHNGTCVICSEFSPKTAAFNVYT